MIAAFDIMTRKEVNRMEKPLVGGQAVIEGVMMRGFGRVATAVREPDGHIAVDVMSPTFSTEV